MIIYDPYAIILDQLNKGEISIIEFMRILTERNKPAVEEELEKLLKQIGETKKKSGKGLLFGVPIQSTQL